MDGQRPAVKVKQASALRPSTEALFEVGKAMLTDSVAVGREFSKFMITVATGAVPIYLGLIGLLGINVTDSLVWFVPPGLLVLSVVLFVFAYFPRHGSFSIEIKEEIEAARLRAISGRDKFLYSGLSVFLSAVLLSAYVIIAESSKPDAKREQYEFAWVELPKTATADEIAHRLTAFREQINASRQPASIEFQKVPSESATVIVAIIRSKDTLP